MPTTLSLAKLLNHIKGYSSYRMGRGRFWQKGYFARVIEKDQLFVVFNYIRNQYHHHSNNHGILAELEIQYLAKENAILKKAS